MRRGQSFKSPTASGSTSCTTAFVPGTAVGRRPRSSGALPLPQPQDRPPASNLRSGARSGDHLQARPNHRRRPLREQRLAAGAAQADDEDHVGPDGLDQPEARRGAAAQRRRPHRVRSTAATPRSCRSPIVPGHPENSVTAFLGYGRQTRAASARRRTRRRRTSTSIACAPPTRRSSAAVSRSPGSASYPLARTQEHHLMEGAHPVRATTLEEYKKRPGSHRASMGETPPKTLTMIPEWEYNGLQVGHVDRPDVVHRMRHVHRSPARPRTTSRSSARNRSIAGARCTGSASTTTSRATVDNADQTVPPAGARACSARTRPASWSARSARRRTAPKA